MERRRRRRPSESDRIRIGPSQIPKRLKLTPSISPGLDKSQDEQIATNGGIDRFSALPDSVIQHILSFLPVEDVVKSQVLSKRWLSVWAEVPVLRFSDRYGSSIWCFFDFVEEILGKYRGNKVEKVEFEFSMTMGNDWRISSELDDWIRFATERCAEELGFNLRGDSPIYVLPQSLYSNSSLRRLETNSCIFKVKGIVSWTSLRVLSISKAELSDNAMARILSGSPNLEYLKMHHVDGVNKIIDSNSSLKELVIDGWGNSTSAIEISGSNINSLTLSGTLSTRKIKANLSSLVEFDIDLYGGYTSSMSLLAQLHHVEKISVRPSFLENLSICEKLPLPCPLTCKSLIVDIIMRKGFFGGVVNLLQYSPNLEKLTINLFNYDNRMQVDLYWKSLNICVKCHHLKSVEITGFNAEFFSSVVEFLLKSAPVLEKMVIYAQSNVPLRTTCKLPELPDLSEVNKLFLSYPNVTAVFKTYLK